MNELILKGIPSSLGLAFGKVVIIHPDIFIIPTETIPPEKTDEEIIRLKNAFIAVLSEMQTAYDKLKNDSMNISAMIEANILILQDEYLVDNINNRIKLGFSAENAVVMEFDAQKQFLKLSKDILIRDRAVELDHIKERLIAILRNKNIQFNVEKGSIIIAQTISPTDLISLKESGIGGFVTEAGGISSHTSILARTFEIPAVIGIKNATHLIQKDNRVIIDGYSGTVIVNPSNLKIKDFKSRKIKETEKKRSLGKIIKLKSETKDNRHIKLMANVNFPEDVEAAALVMAEGIGLVRSEHLIISLGHYPNFEEQLKWYTEISERAYPTPVTIRAFDVGSDKFAEGLSYHENNPALGIRGIRFLLQRTDIFRTQILAVLRTSKNKNVRFMLPMISSLDEFSQSMNLIEDCKKELEQSGFDYDPVMPVGVMIETPAAALIADCLAETASFFSIGTNDLTQYALAADRTNELLSDFFDTFHPAVLRLIQMTVNAAKNKNIPVGICGEIAGHTAATPILIGFGIDELSVNPSIILEMKKHIRELNFKDSQLLAEEILQCKTYEEIRKKLSIT